MAKCFLTSMFPKQQDNHSSTLSPILQSPFPLYRPTLLLPTSTFSTFSGRTPTEALVNGDLEDQGSVEAGVIFTFNKIPPNSCSWRAGGRSFYWSLCRAALNRYLIKLGHFLWSGAELCIPSHEELKAICWYATMVRHLVDILDSIERVLVSW